MRMAMGLLLFAAIGLATASAKDDVVGAIWGIKLKNPKGEFVEVIKVRATLKGEIYYDGKPIGTHTHKGDDVKLVIDKKGPKLNGTYTLTKIKKDATIWAGTFKNEDGKEIPVRMGLIKD